MFKYLTGLILLFAFFSFSANAQIKFSDDPEAFVKEAKTLMKSSNNEKCSVTGKEFADTTWSALSASNKKEVVKVAKQMAKRRHRTFPQFNDFFSAVNGAVAMGMATADIDTFLIVTGKAMDELDNKQINIYLTTLRTFLGERKLFSSNYNSLKVEGGTFSFKWKDAEPEYDPYANYGEEDEEEEEDPWGQTDSSSGDDNWDDYFSDWDTDYEEEWGNDWGDDWDNEPAQEEDSQEEVNKYDVGYAAPPQPTVDGPVIEFSDVNLVFIMRDDTVAINNTDGTFSFNENIFVGNGGRFDWSSVGYNPEDCYVEFKEYNFNVKKTKLTAEGVTLFYPDKTEKEVEGVFEYVHKKAPRDEDKEYPRFRSYNSNINIKGLGNDIVYKGGLSLAGQRMYSSSIDEGTSSIEVKKNGETKFKAKSVRFGLGDSLITADYSKVTVYTGSDSITHPGTAFKYNRSSSILRITKTDGFRNAPFIDTYHKMGITADAIIWDLNTKNIDFTILNAKNHIPAVFESEEYYEYNKYSLLQGMYRFHPLQLIVGYAELKNVNEMYVIELADKFKIDETTLKGAMKAMMKYGFIEYNIKTGHIKLRDKATHYVHSRRDKSDYDNLTFISLYEAGSNATMDLETYELKVRGVDKIYVSDSLSVYIVPDNHEITILKGRNFNFNGKINTANFQFVGENFQFNYDSFLVHMPNIDQIKLAVDASSVDKEASKGAKVLGNELRYSSGTLYINKPDNKSARKKHPEYPIFEADKGASVFFDKSEIAGGAYDTTLQFKIPPFTVDSLSSDDPHAIAFDGTFTSGGIFPDFDEKLVVMPDFSLGFVHQAPEDGYQLYEGKGKFLNTLRMDNKGLTGDGIIHYLNTTCNSEAFHFYPDSVLTIGTSAVTEEGTNPELDPSVNFPQWNIGSYDMRWLAKRDSMHITNTSAPFHIYNKAAILTGTNIITEKGNFGSGVLEMEGSETASGNFHFEKTRYEARNANFSIKSDNPSKPAVRCVNVKLDFSFEDKKAFFSPEIKGFASNEFPYSQYKSSIANGTWDMNEQIIVMEKPEEEDISQSYFYSTNPEQDSLVFNATKAVYDIEKLKLNITGVPHIVVADAKVYPDSNRVTILENAVMETLFNTEIVMDTIKEYHRLYNGRIDVLSRYKMAGDALYNYKNPSGQRQVLEFKDFRFDDTSKKEEEHQTVSTGMVMPEDSIEVSDKLLYKGKATMYSKIKPLYWDGYVKLNLSGALSYSQWLKYKNDGDTSAVKISLVGAKADNGLPITSGLFLKKGSDELYTSFISQKKEEDDHELFVSLGDLEVFPDSGEFRIVPNDEVKKSFYKNNVLRYFDHNSTIKYEGAFNFLYPMKKFSLAAAGYGSASMEEEKYKFNTMMIFNMKMHKKVAQALGTDLAFSSKAIVDSSRFGDFDSEKAQLKQDQRDFNLKVLAGEKKADKYIEKALYEPVSLTEVSKDFKKALVFKEVNMEWSAEYNAWYSKGKLNVSNFYKEDISKEMNGFMEIKKTPRGDVVSIYLEPSEYSWYYFSYDDNRLAILTSDHEVNDVINGKSKGDLPDRKKFFFTEATAMEKAKFVTDFEEKYMQPETEETEEDSLYIALEQMELEEMDLSEVRKVIKRVANVQKGEEERSEKTEYEFKEMDLPEPKKKKVKKGLPEEEWKTAPRKAKPQQSQEERRQLQKEQQRLRDMLR
ncbi:hypothetical protein RCC89_04580 [Cytophagaceae bacterium ABcell3]|nr:hypothetical protein RCC89_04580 [Cytophagaceae bacterium ABcell3]